MPSVIEEKAEPKEKKVTKNDPRLVAAARELKDRWLEQLNATPLLSSGKYNVSRAIEVMESSSKETIISIVPALPAIIAA